MYGLPPYAYGNPAAMAPAAVAGGISTGWSLTAPINWAAVIGVFGAVAAPSFVQQGVGTSADASSVALAVTLGADPTAGNALICLISFLSTNSDSGPTNPNSDLFNLAATSTVAGVTTEIWCATNIIGGADSNGVQLNAVNPTRISMSVSEFSGLNDALASATNTNTGIAGSTVTTNSVTPAGAHYLGIAMAGWNPSNYLSGPTGGWTRLTAVGGAGAFQEGAYLIG